MKVTWEKSEKSRSRGLGLVRSGAGLVSNLLNLLADLVIPRECLACGSEGSDWCFSCSDQISFDPPVPTCPSCPRLSPRGSFCFEHRPDWPLTGIIWVGRYRQPSLKLALNRLKYDRVRELALPLGALVARRLIQGPAKLRLDRTSWVAPVPLHPARLRWRGFNQAELIGRLVAQSFGLTWVPDLLERSRATRTQVGLSGDLRLNNVAGAFRVGSSYRTRLKGCSVILVDDVMTSGATLGACALALRRSGARQVRAALAARD